MRERIRLIILYHFTTIGTLCLLDCEAIKAQGNDSLSTLKEQGWIEDKSHQIGIDISFNNSYEIFEIKSSNTKYILSPNTPTNLQINLNYRFLSLAVQYAPDFIPGNGDNGLKGKTNSFEFAYTLYLRHWFVGGSFAKVKGYYLKNTSDFIEQTGSTPYIQFPDLHYWEYKLDLGYNLNPKFSFPSITSQTERQLKSAGSFIPVSNIRYYKIDDQSSNANTQMSQNMEISIGTGYAYTFVLREKFYWSLGLFTTAGYMNSSFITRLLDGQSSTKQDNWFYKLNANMGIGYNGQKYYAGLYALSSEMKYKQENTQVVNQQSHLYYHFFIGIRFDAPNSVASPFTKIERLFSNLF